MLFSIEAAPIYIATHSVGGFPSLHTLSRCALCRLFEDGHSDWCEEESHYSFHSHFSNNE